MLNTPLFIGDRVAMVWRGTSGRMYNTRGTITSISEATGYLGIFGERFRGSHPSNIKKLAKYVIKLMGGQS
jgi:hypothetical protein